MIGSGLESDLEFRGGGNTLNSIESTSELGLGPCDQLLVSAGRKGKLKQRDGRDGQGELSFPACKGSRCLSEAEEHCRVNRVRLPAQKDPADEQVWAYGGRE